MAGTKGRANSSSLVEKNSAIRDGAYIASSFFAMFRKREASVRLYV